MSGNLTWRNDAENSGWKERKKKRRRRKRTPKEDSRMQIHRADI